MRNFCVDIRACRVKLRGSHGFASSRRIVKKSPGRALRPRPVVVRSFVPKNNGKLPDEPKSSSEEENKPKGFMEGKSWPWFFEQEVESEEDVNNLIKQISHFDRLCALLLIAVVVPGLPVYPAFQLLELRPLQYAHLDTFTFLQALCTALPLVFVDVWLFLGASEMQELNSDFQDVSDYGQEDGNQDGEAKMLESYDFKMTYGFAEALRDYASWARKDVSMMVKETPTPAVLPVIGMAVAVEEVVGRGIVLGWLTQFFNGWVQQNGLDGPALKWGSTTGAGVMSDAVSAQSLLISNTPPTILAAEMAFLVYLLGSAVSIGLSKGRMEDADVEFDIVSEVEDLDSLLKSFDDEDSKVLQKLETQTKNLEAVKKDKEAETKGKEAASTNPEAGSKLQALDKMLEVEDKVVDADKPAVLASSSTKEPTETESKEELDIEPQVMVELEVLSGPRDIEALRNFVRTIMAGAQWTLTGNLYLPIMSMIIIELVHIVLVKHSDIGGTSKNWVKVDADVRT